MILKNANWFRLSHLPFSFFLMLLAFPVVAQTSDAKINDVRASRPGGQGWEVIVRFDSNFDTANANETTRVQNESNYRIVAINAGVAVPVDDADFYKVNGQIIPNRIKLQINSPTALNTTDIFHLYALNLTLNNLPTAESLQAQIRIGPGPKPPSKPEWGLTSSKGREDSDLYGSYELTKTQGSATTGTGDFKLKIPFRKEFWGKVNTLSPVVDFKASSDAEADADSLRFAFEWERPIVDSDNPESKFPFTSVYLVNSGKIEAPKNFDNINVLWEARWIFPSAHFSICKRIRCFLDPFVGHELGKNLKSPLQSAEGNNLFRLMVGADLAIQVPIKGLAFLKGVELNSAYIRRWPLKRELLVDKDANGNLVGLALSKGPKDYSDSKFIIKINDYFGPYIGYEWGRLPPNYELVDHKWTFGILFKSKVRAGGE